MWGVKINCYSSGVGGVGSRMGLSSGVLQGKESPYIKSLDFHQLILTRVLTGGDCEFQAHITTC